MIATLRNHHFTATGVFLLGLVLFTIGLDQQEVIGFESRFYLFAQEMWRNGPSWFPTTYGVPYPDYPATSTLLIYAVASLFKHLDKLTAVLPSAIAAAVTLAMTYQIGALRSRQWGWFAVCFLLLTNTFVMEARTISTDQYVAMVTTLCFYLIYSATLTQHTRRLWFVPLLLLAGFACRGPIGLVVPAGVVCGFYLCDRNFKLFWLMGMLAALLLALSCAVLFKIAYQVGGMPFVHAVWFTEVSGRLQEASLPWYFYFTESFGAYALTFPLVVLIGCGSLARRDAWQTDDARFILKLAAWVAVILCGLSLPAGKKVRYLLAMAPALALITAALFALPARATWQRWLRKSVLGVCASLPTLCLVFLAFMWHYLGQHATAATIGVMRSLTLTVQLTMWLFVVWQALILLGRQRPLVIIGMAALTWMTCYILLVERINRVLNQAQTFVRVTETARLQQHARLVFYQENPDGTPIKYVINMQRNEVPEFISTPDALAHYHAPAFFIADPKHFAALPKAILQTVHVIGSGSVGHHELVVFQKMPNAK